MPYKDLKKRKEYHHQWYLDHREEELEKQRQDRRNNPEKYEKYEKQRYLNNREGRLGTTKRSQLKRDYGLSYEDWKGLWYAQDGRCVICDKFFAEIKDIHVDHDHKTGEVRGLLCHKCNVGIGFLNDDPELMSKATAYLFEF